MVKVLSITITSKTEEDYDGINHDIKVLTGTITGDGGDLSEYYSCDSAVSDADAKTAFKIKLTDKGHIWDEES